MTHYSWHTAFKHIEEQGPARIIKFFKLAFQEMPRLERAALSLHPEEQKTARNEITALFHLITIEMQKAIQDSTLSPDEFTNEVKKQAHFTPEEWAALARIPELLGHHHKELFDQKAFKASKKNNPFFKV